MDDVIDLTADEEDNYSNASSFQYIKPESVEFVDLTMSPPSPSAAARKRKENDNANQNKITDYFPLSPSKKPKQQTSEDRQIITIEDDDDNFVLPAVDPLGLSAASSDTPVPACSSTIQFVTAQKGSAGSSCGKGSDEGFTTASSSSAGPRGSLEYNHPLTHNEDAMCGMDLTPSASFADASEAANVTRLARSPAKQQSPVCNLTSMSSLPKSASPLFADARKNLFSAPPAEPGSMMLDDEEQGSMCVTDLGLEQEVVLNGSAGPSHTTTTVPPVPTLEITLPLVDDAVVLMAESEEGVVYAPMYGALIAQCLRTMTIVTSQCATFLRTTHMASAPPTPAHEDDLIHEHGALPASSRGSSGAGTKAPKDTARLKKRIQLLEGMLFLRPHAEETSIDHAVMDAAIIHAKTVFRESPNSPGMVKLMNKALKQSTLGVYLLLIECKCAVLKERSLCASGDASQAPGGTNFDVLGLGSWKELEQHLRRLLHLSHDDDGSGPDPGTHGAAAASSSAVTSKASQRKAAQDKVHSVLAGEGGAPAPGATKVRTAMDAMRAIAEAESSECALGMRILSVWCDYMGNIRRQNERVCSAGLACDPHTTVFVECVQSAYTLIADLRSAKVASDKESRNKNKSPETTRERDARLFMDVLADLCAEMFGFMRGATAEDASLDMPTSNIGLILSDVMSLQDVFVSYEDWRDEQERKRKAASAETPQYVQYLLKELQAECDAVLSSWHTLNVSECTLCYVMAQLGALLGRVAQCIVTAADDTVEEAGDIATVLSSLEDCPALQRQSAHIHRLCCSLLTKMRVTLHPMTNTQPCGARLRTSMSSDGTNPARDDSCDGSSGGDLRAACDSLLQTVARELQGLKEGSRESGASCGSNTSAGSNNSSKGRGSPDERLLELVMELSLK